ncbi:hypothetical protein J1N35_015030 [Gossypium stocksii]|uniref:Aminotransferase-like plant mobile domain-containing protein n=1 Tax=Gossypium stocksii TaxID=47602 RepID=A0A9D3VXI9_9ROSI|nr:hypothetical protein J1N35_015030 [Gossypium stocksii]
MIEGYAGDRFVWMPYIAPDIASVSPPLAGVDAMVWCVDALIINFQTVEWYVGDRVLCQFGCSQHISDIPIQLRIDVYGIDKKGKHAKNLALVGEKA